MLQTEPGFPVEVVGATELQAAFLAESRMQLLSASAALEEIREATGLSVVFFQGKPHLAIFIRPQELRNCPNNCPENAAVTSSPVKLIECPRDAWQAMPQQIPPEVKADYLRALAAAGFTHIDAVSFVSPAAVPQMADSEQVLALLDLDPAVEIIAIVVNEQGAERAVRTGAVRTLGFPYSISATFLERNQKQTLQQARQTLKNIYGQASQAGLGVVAYLSMAFGNPYGEPWRQEDVIDACRTLKGLGIEQISLADTVGVATAEQVHTLVSAVLAEIHGIELGAHLHARPEQAALKVAAAYQAGCRRLDMALGGQGGCPFAQDALVGNVATEAALAELSKLGANLPRLLALDELLAMGRAIADKFGAVGAY